MFRRGLTSNDSSNKAPGVLHLLALAVLFAFSVAPEAVGQVAPKATIKTETNPTPRRSSRPRQPRPTTALKTPASVESENFLLLGERFREKEMWNAAEAAYKEAQRSWPGNGEALLELGYLYLDEKNPDLNKKLENARSAYNKLRSVDSSRAATLLADINRFQAQVAH